MTRSLSGLTSKSITPIGAAVFPPEVVDEVLAKCGRLEQRHRLLPARVVVYYVYYVLGLSLFSSSSYQEVMRMLVWITPRPNN